MALLFCIFAIRKYRITMIQEEKHYGYDYQQSCGVDVVP